MKSRRNNLLAMLLLMTSICSLGQTISHVQQLPMHYNPAFAGEKGYSRVAAYVGADEIRKGTATYTGQTIVTSFDTRNKKQWLGYGIEGIGYRRAVADYRKETSTEMGGFKACIAPKIRLSPNDTIHNWVFSPAIGYTYLTSNNNSFNYIDYVGSFKRLTDSLIFRNQDAFMANKRQELSIGVLLQNRNFRLGISYSRLFYQANYDRHIIITGVDPFEMWKLTATQRDSIEAAHTTLEGGKVVNFTGGRFSFYISQTFKLLKKDDLYMTPYASVTYLTFQPKVFYVNELEKTFLGASVLGIDLKFRKAILGVMRLSNQNANGLCIGYDWPNINIRISLSKSRNDLAEDITYFAISSNWLLNKPIDKSNN